MQPDRAQQQDHRAVQLRHEAAQGIDPGELVADGVGNPPAPGQGSGGQHRGGQQRHPRRHGGAVGQPRGEKRQEQHRAGPLAVLQAVAEGHRAGGDGLRPARAAVHHVGRRVPCSPGGRPHQQVRAHERDHGGQQQRQRHLEQQGVVDPADVVSAHQHTGQPGAGQAAHQGVRGRGRNAAPPRVDAPQDGAEQACNQDGQAVFAVRQRDPASADLQRQGRAERRRPRS